MSHAGMDVCEGFAAVVLRPTNEGASGIAAPVAIIRGSALNQGGRSSGLTAPNGPAQSSLIKCARSPCLEHADGFLSAASTCLQSHAALHRETTSAPQVAPV